jgi:glyoxylase-like metal-dependent hydrolase (beta-lactamase superfamily II)
MVGEVWQIGKVKITRIVEIEATGGMSRIIPDATRDKIREIGWLYPHFADETGRLRGAIHSLVVDTGERKILVDTCVGNDKERAVPAWNNLQTQFLKDLADAGYPMETIDTVLCTHLHIDHVGWNTKWDGAKWVPTFPHAQYLFGKKEYEHWAAQESAGPYGQSQVMADSVTPIIEAGLHTLVEQNHVVCPEISLIPTPGHTPGHASVFIESEGETALITGDFLHHPCQMAHPEWPSAPDTDPIEGRATRLNMYNRFAETPTLVIGTHFHTPTAGHIKTDGKAWRLDVGD